jgi:hypothetical protein
MCMTKQLETPRPWNVSAGAPRRRQISLHFVSKQNEPFARSALTADHKIRDSHCYALHAWPQGHGLSYLTEHQCITPPSIRRRLNMLKQYFDNSFHDISAKHHITLLFQGVGSGVSCAEQMNSSSRNSRLWNTQIHYRVQNSPPLVPTLNGKRPVHNHHSVYVKPSLKFPSHLYLDQEPHTFPKM